MEVVVVSPFAEAAAATVDVNISAGDLFGIKGLCMI
jgi:hypothetical protein